MVNGKNKMVKINGKMVKIKVHLEVFAGMKKMDWVQRERLSTTTNLLAACRCMQFKIDADTSATLTARVEPEYYPTPQTFVN